MKAKKRILDIFTSLIILLSLFVLTIGLLPKLTSYDAYYVISDSMYPAIKKGDLVFTKEVKFEEIEVDDVLTFTKDGSGRWFSHRVVKINEAKQSFRTKGDNNNVEDPGYTSFDNVVGRVEKKFPLVGFLPMALSTTWGKIILVVIYAVYIAVEIENFRHKKEGSKA